MIALHYESTAPLSRPQLPREVGASAGFTICDLAVSCARCVKLRALDLREDCGKIQMLPPIEFFMGMLAGGILDYFIAIMVSSGSGEVRVCGAAEHDTRYGD